MGVTVCVLALVVGMCTAKKCTDELPNGQHCPKGKGPFFYPDPDHCSRYWQCDNGCASHMLCDMDFLYDDKHAWCNTPQQVDCGTRDCDNRDCKDPEPPFNFTCPHPDGLFADPSNCMKYFQCYMGVPDRKSCPTKEGQQLLYDPSTTWCDWPDRVNCGARPICDVHDKNCDHTPSELPTKTTKPSPSHDFTCPKPNGLFPDPKNCMKYYQCYENTATRMSCQFKSGQQLLYDPTTTWCDWPDRVTCGARPVCDIHDKNCNSQPTQAPTTTKAPNACDKFGACAKPGDLKPQGDCQQCFCECGSGKWLQICCQPHLVFNERIGQCDWTFNVPDCKQQFLSNLLNSAQFN